MTDKYRALQQATLDAVLRGPGTTSPALRQQVARGEAPAEAPAELQALVRKIRTEAWRVTDEDWAPLAARYSEDELFELVVAAVVGAADHRLQAALRVWEQL